MTDGGPSSPDSDDVADADERSLDDLLAALEAELRATEELPVSPAASVWLGEAHAVAADLTSGTLQPTVIHERTAHVQTLLRNVGDTDNAAAEEHVDKAQRVAAAIVARTDASNRESE